MSEVATKEKTENSVGTTVIGITGMHCASCVAAIEKSLKKMKGVSSVVVNLASEKAYVDFDPAEIEPKDLRKAIEDTGYGAVDVEEKDMPVQPGGTQEVALNIGRSSVDFIGPVFFCPDPIADETARKTNFTLPRRKK